MYKQIGCKILLGCILQAQKEFKRQYLCYRLSYDFVSEYLAIYNKFINTLCKYDMKYLDK